MLFLKIAQFETTPQRKIIPLLVTGYLSLTHTSGPWRHRRLRQRGRRRRRHHVNAQHGEADRRRLDAHGSRVAQQKAPSGTEMRT